MEAENKYKGEFKKEKCLKGNQETVKDENISNYKSIKVNLIINLLKLI